MLDSVKNIFSSGSSYQDYNWYDYQRYTTMVSSGVQAGYSYLPEAKVPEFVQSGFAKAYSHLPEMKMPEISNPFASSATSYTETIWNHKEWVAGGLVVAVIGIAATYFLTRKVAQKPDVKWQPTLNKGILQISVPKTEKKPPNVNISFCIDTSGSMQGDREGSVKAGVNRVIDNARGVMKVAGARIDMGAIGFNNKAHKISDPTSITKESDAGLKGRVDDYDSAGGTSIVAGINGSIQQLKEMAKANKTGKNVLILLSDGQDNVSSGSVDKIRRQLGSVNGEIFAIGIGDSHNKTTLQEIAGEANYIDTTQGVSIEDAITRMYEVAIAKFSEMKLQLHGVPGNKWLMGQTTSNAESKVDLGALTEEDAGLRARVKIDSKSLDTDLDLRRVELELTYRDPRGIPGRIRLPWGPDTIIRPDVLRA